MKTTNTDNTNTAIETTVSEMVYIGTRVSTQKFEERTEIRIWTFECIDIDTIIKNYVYEVRCNYIVKNPLTSEEHTYNNESFEEWCKSKTLAKIANYRIIRTRESGECHYPEKCEAFEELHFTSVMRSEVPEVEKPLWLLKVYNADTNELVSQKWYESSGEMLHQTDMRVLDWRYTETGVANLTFNANGVDITRHFCARDRKRYTLSPNRWDRGGIHITIDTYCYPSEAKKGKRKYRCSICGKEHFVEEGTFMPHPVRSNKDDNGRYNYCCATCYEKYVGPMRTCCWVTYSWHKNIEELNNIHIYWGEGRFYKLTTSEMDIIIKLENLRKEAMAYLRMYEHKNADDEAIRLRNKSQDRRWKAQQAAKLAEQETK